MFCGYKDPFIMQNKIYYIKTNLTGGANAFEYSLIYFDTLTNQITDVKIMPSFLNGTTASYAGMFYNNNNVAFFNYAGVWSSNGTNNFTQELNGVLYLPSCCTKGYNDYLCFSHSEPEVGYELWLAYFDGNSYNVKDIYDGPNSSYPNSLTVYDSLLFFTATDSANGRQLWKTDVSLVNTTKVFADTVTNYYNSLGTGKMFVVDSFMLLNADYLSIGSELYVIKQSSHIPLNTKESINIKSNSFYIYPNPSNSIVELKSQNKYHKIFIDVFDAIGNKIMTTDKTQFDFSNFTNGLYFFKVKYDDKIEMLKFIKTN